MGAQDRGGRALLDLLLGHLAGVVAGTRSLVFSDAQALLHIELLPAG